MVAQGFGKVILFGEHFVVYGLPSIAGGIDKKTIAYAEKSDLPGLHVIDKRPAVPGYKEGKREQFKESLSYIKDAVPQIPWDVQGIQITLKGDLVAASGIGASAAACVAIARAVNEFFGLDLDDAHINNIAYEGERGYHGSPSGVDNTCATYGKVIYFQKRSDGDVLEVIEPKEPIKIVMANTGIPVNTKAVVEGVRHRREENPELFEGIFSEYAALAKEALPVVERGDWKKMGELMNQNQDLLRQIGVSHERLEELISAALDAGAYGAKLTGGGAGGYMVALTPTADLQEAVESALKEKSKLVLSTSIG